MAKRRVYNHRSKIGGRQAGQKKFVTSGMIVEFRYEGKNVSDPRPLCIILYNELNSGQSRGRTGKSNLIHAINLNYLQDTYISKLFEKLQKGSGVYSPQNINILSEAPQDETSLDDNLPGRNLLKKPYTQIELPQYRRIREGNPMSKAEASRQMEMLYDKVLRNFVNFHDVYRTYSADKIKELRVVLLKKLPKALL